MTPPPGGHVFLPIRIIFELNRHIQKTHVLTKFQEDWTKNVSSRVEREREKTAPPCGGHIFSPIWTIFELIRDINETTAKIVTSRVFTRNNALSPGGHLHEDWASNVTCTVFTSFELSGGINRTTVLTKFHEDRIINSVSRVFTRQNVDDGRCTTDKRRSQKLTMSTLCSVTSSKTASSLAALIKQQMKTAPFLGAMFHKDRTINGTSRVNNFIELMRPSFELGQNIIRKNVFTKFCDD
ncbi:hypothetical protein DPMN_097417 [Dreissena polymorpha]|uniref:Uncharacterized protein n=1 Tax=Dreissena polymorpha TaxID=45954 RepID=A0A9D4LBP5_DREPO|nr:hypothetical protein DPMN_097417 [Dreissena polymorpha]